MPAPTVVCSTCGSTVNKRQTLLISPGVRACRVHSETVGKAQEVQEAARKEREKLKEHTRERSKPWKFADGQAPIGAPRCFVCKCEGLREDDWFARFLLEWEKFELEFNTFLNILNHDHVKAIVHKMSGTPRLNWVYWTGQNTRVRLSHMQYQLASIAGVILACDACVKQHKMVTAREQATQQITFDQLVDSMVVIETAKPALRNIARMELQNANRLDQDQPS